MAAPLQGDDRRGVDQDALRHRALGAQLSHIIVVVYAFVSIIGFFTYGFKGIGKFAAEFLPWHLSPNQYALILVAITAIYVIKGGMISVVITEVVQFFILAIASLCRGHYRHDEGGSGDAAQGGARRLGQSLLRLAFGPGLVDTASRGHGQDCRRTGMSSSASLS